MSHNDGLSIGQRAYIRRLSRNGHSVDALALKYDVSVHVVRKVLEVAQP